MTKIKLLPSKKPSPKWVPYAAAVGYVLVLVFAVMAWCFSLYLLIISFAVILALCFVSRLFSWYTEAELRKTNSFLVYEVTNVIGVLGRDKTRYDIHSVDRVEKRGNRLFVWGDITCHEPMSKARKIKRVVIDDIIPDGEVLVSGYKSR